MKKQIVLILLSIIFVTFTTNVNARGTLLGGKTEIKDVQRNKEVQDLGKFSVQEYNRNLVEIAPSPLRDMVGSVVSDEPLMFVEVVEAQRQVVSGLKYYLKVKAMQNGRIKIFDAVVVVKPWVQSKQLLNFGPSPQ